MRIALILNLILVCSSFADYYSLYNKCNGQIMSDSVRGITISGNTIYTPDGYPMVVTDNIAGIGVLVTTEPVGTVSGPDGVQVRKNIVDVAGTLTDIDTVAYTTKTILNTLIASVWSIADYYGVTNEPLNWFTLDSAINASSESADPVVAMKALRDGVRLDKNAMFLKEWGVDLFNITRPAE